MPSAMFFISAFISKFLLIDINAANILIFFCKTYTGAPILSLNPLNKRYEEHQPMAPFTYHCTLSANISPSEAFTSPALASGYCTHSTTRGSAPLLRKVRLPLGATLTTLPS